MPASTAPPYRYKPHEMPFFAGSPAKPDHPPLRKLAYVLIALLLGTAAGLQNGLLLAAMPQVQGALNLSPVEGGLVQAAFYMTYGWMSMLLFKVRQHFGIDRFTRLTIVLLLALNVSQLFVNSLGTELLARAFSGFAANAMMVLSIYYFLQGFPRKMMVMAPLCGLGMFQVGYPLGHVIVPLLLIHDQIIHLYLFQFGLSLMVAGSVYLLPLPEGITEPAFTKLDFLSFGLYALGMACVSLFLVMGRVQSWDMPWLGGALSLALVCLGTSLFIEYHRRRPMLMVRWMGTRDIVLFALTGALLRLLVSEQSVTAGGLMHLLGMGNEQLIVLYGLETLGCVLGIVVALWRLDPTDVRRPLLGSLLLIAISAFSDMHSSPATRPEQLYLTQFVLSFAILYFVLPQMLEGLARAMAYAPHYIISFVAVFNVTQTVAGLAGSAALAHYQQVRAKAQLLTLGSDASLADPLVAQRIHDYAAALSSSISDPLVRQAEATAMYMNVLARDANINAFNDVFAMVGAVATIALLCLCIVWIMGRRNHANSVLPQVKITLSRSPK